MKRQFIVNPRAGTTSRGKGLPQLDRLLRSDPDWPDAVFPASRDSAIQATQSALSLGVEQIVAVGGDGTVNAVVNGFFKNGRPISDSASLLVADTGTGSDYYRAIVAEHSTSARPLAHWSEMLDRHTIRKVDVGLLRYSDGSCSEQYFVNMASVGMVAEVVARKDRAARWLPRTLRYLGPTLAALCSAKPRRLRIVGDDYCEQIDALAVTISKGPFAGGGMRFGGHVTLFDGRLDVSIIRAMPRAMLLAKLPKLYRGTLKDDPRVVTFGTHRLSVSADCPASVEFDGEVLGTTDVEVSVMVRALHVCFPEAE